MVGAHLSEVPSYFCLKKKHNCETFTCPSPFCCSVERVLASFIFLNFPNSPCMFSLKTFTHLALFKHQDQYEHILICKHTQSHAYRKPPWRQEGNARKPMTLVRMNLWAPSGRGFAEAGVAFEQSTQRNHRSMVRLLSLFLPTMDSARAFCSSLPAAAPKKY